MSTGQMNISETSNQSKSDNISLDTKWNIIRYTIVLLSVIVMGIVLLAGLNRILDPLNFGGTGRTEVVEALLQGRNVALHDPNFDFRGLRREHVSAMTLTPDVIAFAGSRFELATKDLFPERSFYNAFVHNDYFEDLLAISELLRSNNRLPRTLIISVRFLSFRPSAQRETEEWKMFWPEYRAMADRLGIEKIPLSEIWPWRHWSQLFSLGTLRRQLATRFEQDQPAPRPITESRLADFDVLHADGSLAFSNNHQITFTPEASRKDAAARGARAAAAKEWPVDWGRVTALGKLLSFLRAEGVQVAVAITPHHPAYWAAVADAPYGQTLKAIEREVEQIVLANGAVMAGSFDPTRAGCQESSFRDYIHIDETCLKAVFDKIPPRPS